MISNAYGLRRRVVSQKYPNSRIDADASSDRVFRSGDALKVDIVMVPNVDEAVPAITRRLGTLQLVRIEGFCGVGKTRLAHRLSEITGATHIATDIFAFRPDRPSPYRDCIKRPELAAEIKRAIAASNLVVLDGVCLDEVAPQAEWGRGLLVYVKRLSSRAVRPSGTMGSTWRMGKCRMTNLAVRSFSTMQKCALITGRILSWSYRGNSIHCLRVN